MTQFRITRLSEYSDEAIIAEIRRVANLDTSQTLTITKFRNLAKVSINTVRRRFGSWESALTKAGIEERFSGQSGGVPPARLSKLSDEEVLDLLRQLPILNGGQPVEVKDIDSYCNFSSDWVRKRFGRSVRSILEELGLPLTKSGREYSDNDCLENLLAVWSFYGRQPKFAEMNQPPSKVGSKAYLRFGSWIKALEAMIEGGSGRVESQLPVDEGSVSPQNSILEVAASEGHKKSRSRSLALSLRFEILNRDSFKCVLCGNSPSTDPTCKLHVDHIFPFSKGGLNTPENLRSLCSSCNLGKGDRHDD
jgi:hypothetical protein